MNIENIIKMYGGYHALAKELKTSTGAIWYWKTVGRIPPSRWESLLKIAKDKNLNIRESDFVELLAKSHTN